MYGGDGESVSWGGGEGHFFLGLFLGIKKLGCSVFWGKSEKRLVVLVLVRRSSGIYMYV